MSESLWISRLANSKRGWRTQPTDLGDLYNGMLKNTVTFEIKHMEKLKEELMDLL